MPLSSASTRKPATSASDTRFEIVIVKRSLAAANAIRAGKQQQAGDVEDHGLVGRRAADARSEHRPKPSGQMMNNRETAARRSSPDAGDPRRQHDSASTSARQTSPSTSVRCPPAGLLAAAAAASRLTHTPPNSHQKNKGPGVPGAFAARSVRARLLQRAVDRGELGVQRGAEAVDDGDDRERDAGGNQAVFDGGGAGLDPSRNAQSGSS